MAKHFSFSLNVTQEISPKFWYCFDFAHIFAQNYVYFSDAEQISFRSGRWEESILAVETPSIDRDNIEIPD